MDINKKIDELKLELKKLESITEKRFKTSKELQDYVNKNESTYQKANNIEKQIQQLEWELMTPKERKAEEELVEKMKLKREGKL